MGPVVGEEGRTREQRGWVKFVTYSAGRKMLVRSGSSVARAERSVGEMEERM